MAVTAQDIRNKTFATKFRGYDVEEVDDFLEILMREFEDLTRQLVAKDEQVRNLEERLLYFDEMKDSLSQSVLIAQDAAEKVKQTASDESNNIIRQAEQDSQRLLDDAKFKANEILRQATDNAKKVAVETEELKNKTRIFHQQIRSAVESQLSVITSPEWENILQPTASYVQTSDEAFREVVVSALGEDQANTPEETIDMTRQFSPVEVAELQNRIASANQMAETQSYQGLAADVNAALDAVERAERESVDLL
ncbi:DivIVA domain-containing protein [Streptococcus sp. NLN76]|uniref:DivIVA domain-containing protein n=1 Tax=Streptococcus sp. NLN76 TaxID=2822800 RepID=UPI0018AA27D2|nr:DivIVA domain-containing protein [Streptococcus sp. NLN76]MBF8970388.1 DivIVA domain-containing protein [Streptococcus sp. NLN76]